MTTTPRLTLPYIFSNQAQKEIVHNDALNDIDALIMLRALDRDLTSPPATPLNGDAYIVAASATGAWAGQDGRIALWYDGWRFKQPRQGWRCLVLDESIVLEHNGTSWVFPSFVADAGSAAAPTLRFGPSTNTGIFSTLSTTLGFATAGTERIRIDGAGNVAIGSTAGAAGTRLRVRSAAATDSIVMIDQADAAGSNRPVLSLRKNGAACFNLNTNNLGNTIYDSLTATGEHVFHINSAERARLASSGHFSLGGAQNAEALRAVFTASAINRVEAQGSLTGARVVLRAAGTDTNIGLRLENKGTALLELAGQTTATTVGAAGGASALPATPLGYLSVVVNGTTVKIPYYTN